jgi:hypothetical protein
MLSTKCTFYNRNAQRNVLGVDTLKKDSREVFREFCQEYFIFYNFLCTLSLGGGGGGRH